MPLYQIYHSYPLEHKQKVQIAQAITTLHSTTFRTPSLFVNVRFIPDDASERNFFVAGKPRECSTNRIMAMVRTSEQRTKAHFDKLATQIEEAWYQTVEGDIIEDGKDKGKRKGEVDETDNTRLAKKLHIVVFHPMIAARENGVVIPGAGQEGTWLKDNMEYFKNQAEAKGDKDFAEMLEEIETRKDLKELIA